MIKYIMIGFIAMTASAHASEELAVGQCVQTKIEKVYNYFDENDCTYAEDAGHSVILNNGMWLTDRLNRVGADQRICDNYIKGDDVTVCKTHVMEGCDRSYTPTEEYIVINPSANKSIHMWDSPKLCS